jgi:hypothetical protein
MHAISNGPVSNYVQSSCIEWYMRYSSAYFLYKSESFLRKEHLVASNLITHAEVHRSQVQIVLRKLEGRDLDPAQAKRRFHVGTKSVSEQ